MFDIRLIRDNPAAFDAQLRRRGHEAASAQALALDEKHRHIQTQLQELQAQRNIHAKLIAEKRQRNENIAGLLEEGARIKESMVSYEEEEAQLKEQLQDYLARLPNILLPEVPEGKDEGSNICVREWGEKPVFNFTPQPHEALIPEAMDFKTAAHVSGARFVYLHGALAKLERALGQFMLDFHTREWGYTEVSPPLLVRSHALYGTGQLPKFADDSFHVPSKSAEDLWLIPTAEVPLTNIVSGEILEEKALPLRFVAHTPCFRSEAGAAGRDTRGIIRQHQFYKVELVSITTPEQASQEHERMTQAAEGVLKALGLPYRVMLLCSGDTGGTSQKTYDLEVWLAGQGVYREISSCSICGDYQARRMNARYRPLFLEKNKPLPFVYTLNGSGVAVGRALLAILENNQNQDGSITIPKVLQPSMQCEKIF